MTEINSIQDSWNTLRVFNIEGKRLYTPINGNGVSSNSVALKSVFQKVPTRHCGLAEYACISQNINITICTL